MPNWHQKGDFVHCIRIHMEPNGREIHFQSDSHELFDVRLPIRSVPKEVHGYFSLNQQVIKKHQVSKIGVFRPLFF